LLVSELSPATESCIAIANSPKPAKVLFNDIVQLQFNGLNKQRNQVITIL
jgi:hypothetical protein